MTDKMHQAVIALYKFWLLRASAEEVSSHEGMEDCYFDISIITGIPTAEVRRIITMSPDERQTILILEDQISKIYQDCERIYGNCTDGSMEACLVHKGYSEAMRKLKALKGES